MTKRQSLASIAAFMALASVDGFVAATEEIQQASPNESIEQKPETWKQRERRLNALARRRK